ncbi:hypothetical protein, partial [Burkholderia multivorans]|uniref:hypothetical protein n=1 Tax=Burkholderia multivorans TaxID=87883 RepID=UPI0021ABF00D
MRRTSPPLAADSRIVFTVPMLGFVPNENARSIRVASGIRSFSAAARLSVGTMSNPAPGQSTM